MRAAIVIAVLAPGAAFAAPVGADETPPARAPLPPAPAAPPPRGDVSPEPAEHAALASVTLDPGGLALGYLEGELSARVTRHVAASLSAAHWDVMNHGNVGEQLVVSAPIFLRETFSGPYVEPGVILRSAGSHDDYTCTNGGAGCGSPYDQWVGPELLAGWSWSLGVLRIAIAAGPAIHVQDNYHTSSDHPGKLDFNAYFHVGVAW